MSFGDKVLTIPENFCVCRRVHSKENVKQDGCTLMIRLL